MTVAVCDDSIEDLTELKRLLTKYMETNQNTRYEIEPFCEAVELYQKIQEKDFADIYILDMIMSEKTGIDIGTLIRNSGNESVIIYITSSDDFAMEAYGVHAVRYLLKPINEKQVFEALDHACSLTKPERETMYLIKTKNGPIAVPYSQIEYIENYSRILHIGLTDGKHIKSIFIRKSFYDNIREIAQDKRFIQPHQSFLVNMSHVDKLAQDCMILKSGKSIPISRKKAAQVKKEYLLFVSALYR
ncbi:MAG: LytTR family DNA-binding domain-containing protein [Lachnospiraceae bacterium]|nr:LytTR family DNA-binding domain-containing protein [Lachnospiraceae bacterium]